LRLRASFRSSLPASLRLASPTSSPAPPSSRPATVAACRSSSHALQSPFSLRLPSIFRLSLPANLYDLRLLVDLSALLPNLTSDSRQRSHLLALPSNQPATVAADPSSGPARGPTPNAYLRLYPYGAALRFLLGLRLRFPSWPCLRSNFRFTSRCVPSALPSSQPQTCVSGQPSGPAWRTNFRIPGRCVLRLRLPSDLRLASKIFLPAHLRIFSLACAFDPSSGYLSVDSLALASVLTVRLHL